MKIEKIFIAEDERREWEERIKRNRKNSLSFQPITRRYLMMVTHPKIRRVIQGQFHTQPYKSGKEKAIFYCLAGLSNRRMREFMKSVIYLLHKDLDPEISGSIEILEGVEATKDLMESVINKSRS